MATRTTGAMRGALRALVATGNFDRFARETDREWRALAGSIRRRAGYTSVEVDDLVQAMLMAVWHHVPQWSPERGDLVRYVMFSAVVAAKRAAQEGKGLQGRMARTPLANPGPFVPVEDPGAMGEPGPSPATPEQLVQTREHVSGYLQHATARDQVLVTAALVHGSIDLGVEHLLRNAPQRMELRLQDDPKWAHRVVRRALQRTIRRAEGEKHGSKTQKEGGDQGGHGGGRRAPGQGERSLGPNQLSPG